MAARHAALRALRWIAVAVSVLAAGLLPVTPAHATYGSDQPVYVQVNSNTGPTQALARLDGTVAFDDGNTKFRYSLAMCWQSAYPSPNLQIVVNGSTYLWGSYAGTTSAPGCQQVILYSAEVTHGGVVANVRFDVTAGWFYPGNQYNSRTRSWTADNPFN